MRRYAVYAVPGADEGEAAEAVRLRAAVEAWFGRDELHGLTSDARRYGFVSAGGGEWYSRSLRALPIGGRVFVYLSAQRECRSDR